MQQHNSNSKYATALPGGIIPFLCAFPVFLWLAGLVAGILAVNLWPCSLPWWTWFIATAAGAALWVVAHRRHLLKTLLIAETVTFMMLGATLGGYAVTTTTALPDSVKTADSDTVAAQVIMQGHMLRWVRSVKGSTSFDLQVQALAPAGAKPQPWEGTVRIRMYGENRLPAATAPGDLLEIRALLQTPQRRNNPGSWDYPGYLKRRGISALATIRAADLAPAILEQNSGGGIEGTINRVRASIAWRLSKAIPQPYLGLVQALTIGERASLYDPIRNNFREAGTSHLLAISGLHLGIIALWAFLLVRILLMILPLRRRPADPARAAAIPAMALVWLFALLTGAKLPALRAAVMVTFFLASLLLRRRTNPYVTLAWAALVLLLIWPLSLFEVGFQLTFSAVLGILLTAPAARCTWLYNKRRKAVQWNAIAGWTLLQRLWDIAWVSVAAFVVTAPIILVNFKYLTVAGLFANIIAVPLVTLLAVPLGMITTVWALLGLPGLTAVSAPMVWSLDVLLRVQTVAADVVSGIASPMTAAITASLLFALGVGLLLLHHARNKIAAAAVTVFLAAILFIGMAPQSTPPQPQAVFFDGGYTPAILLRMPDGASLLIDGSDRGSTGRTIGQALYTYNITEPTVWLRLSAPPEKNQGLGDIPLPQPVYAPDVPSGETRDLLPGVSIANIGPLRHGFRLWRLTVHDAQMYLLRFDDEARHGSIVQYLRQPAAFAHATTGIPCNLIKKTGRTTVVSSPQRYSGPMQICAEKDQKSIILHTGTLGAVECDIQGKAFTCRRYAPDKPL